MISTSIRLSETLKARIAAAAQREGTSSHAFILDAIAEALERSERSTPTGPRSASELRLVSDSAGDAGAPDESTPAAA